MGEAICQINDVGFLAIVITNQPVVARGELKESDLKKIHNKMETLLGRHGAYLDQLYYCPHHTDSGFKGEIKSLKIDCECRKPKIGLLKKAEKILIYVWKNHGLSEIAPEIYWQHKKLG